MNTAGVKLIALLVGLSASNLMAQEGGGRPSRGDAPPPRRQLDADRANRGGDRQVQIEVRERVEGGERDNERPRDRVVIREERRREGPAGPQLRGSGEGERPALRRGPRNGAGRGEIQTNRRGNRGPGLRALESRPRLGRMAAGRGMGHGPGLGRGLRAAPMERMNAIEEAYQRGFRDGFKESNAGVARGPGGRGFRGPMGGPRFRNQIGGFSGGPGMGMRRGMGPMAQQRMGGGGRGPALNDDGAVVRGPQGQGRGPGFGGPRFQGNGSAAQGGPGEGNSPNPGMGERRGPGGPGGPGGLNRGGRMGPGPFGPGMGRRGPGNQGNGPGPRFNQNQGNNGEGFRPGGQPQMNDRGTNGPDNQGWFGRPEPQGDQRGPGPRPPRPGDNRGDRENRPESSDQ